MADQSEYENLVKLIGSIETGYTKKELDFVDVSDTFKGINAQQKSYKEVIAEIESIESSRKPQKEPEKVTAAAAAAAVESHLITTGLAQMQYAHPKPQLPIVRKGMPPISADSLNRQRAAVAKELSTLAGRLGSIKPALELHMKRINTKDLVLPSLSLADQISELERVIEGLNENVFDSDHIAVLSQEVYGLQQTINTAKKSQKTKDSLEQSLLDLRGQRLADAIALLKLHGAN